MDFPSTHGGLLRPNGKKSLWSSHSSTPVQDEIPDGRETAVTPNPTQLSPVDTSIDMDIDDNNSDAGGPSIDGHIEYLASGEEEPTGLDGIKEGSEVEESEGEKLEEIETSTVAEYVAVDDDHVEVEETQYIDGADLIRLPSQAGCFILEPICSDMSETEDEVTSAAELYLKENNKTSGQAESQSSDSC